MPAAANEGIALLCAARPLRGVAELPEGTLEADLGSLAADYGGMGQPEVFCTGGGRLSRVEGWALLGGRMLQLPQGVPGRVLVGYDRTPPRLKDPKPEDRLELAEDAAALLPLYIASQLYKDEDLGLATLYRNEFELGLDRLTAPPPGVAGDRFVSTSGWCG